MSLSHPTFADTPPCVHMPFRFGKIRSCRRQQCLAWRRRVLQILEAESAWAPYTSYTLALYPEVLDALVQ
jgi:hypothetical protein